MPTRSSNMKLHDATMREITDPKNFATIYEPSKQEQLKTLGIDQLEGLMRGLKVKARGSHHLLKFGARQTPGPGDYDWSGKSAGTVAASGKAPVIKKDYNPGLRFRLGEKERVPGPGTYLNQITASSTKPRPPSCTIHRRIIDKVTEGNVKSMRPGPGSYDAFPPFGSQSLKCSLYDRATFENQSRVMQAPGPGAYMLPPTTLNGNVVADWSPRGTGAIHHSSGPVDCPGMAEESIRRTYTPGKPANQQLSPSPRKAQSARPPAKRNTGEAGGSKAPTKKKVADGKQKESKSGDKQQQQQDENSKQESIC